VRRPSTLGEKVGTFFGGGGGCLHYGGEPGDDEGWINLLADLLGVSSPMSDQADGREPRPASGVSCNLFFCGVCACKLIFMYSVFAIEALLI
jgi:hypothetical protein